LGHIEDIQMVEEREVKMIASISADVCKNKGLVELNPLDV
uniref:RNA_pol_Rpb2_7 domain-containing protein n=1 Tax=Anisakis simplex TaxID=6269 RepID=A0A0M3JNP7_ANISI